MHAWFVCDDLAHDGRIPSADLAPEEGVGSGESTALTWSFARGCVVLGRRALHPLVTPESMRPASVRSSSRGEIRAIDLPL